MIERAAIVAGVGVIGLNHLPSPSFAARPGPNTPPAPGPILLQPGHRLTEIDDAYIKLTLEHVNGNRKRAGEMLGISLRTLQNRISRLRDEAKAATPDL